MTITLLLIIIVFTIRGGYFGYRAYILGGLLADQQQYIDELEFTYSMVLDKTKEAYEEMKRIDTVRASQSDDESGTTFLLLKQVIDDLYKETNGTQEEEK